MNLTVTVDRHDVMMRRLEGPAPTLVLLHGAGRNHLSWDEVLPKIGGIDVVAPSLPGRCGSEGDPLTSVADMAAWLRSLLRKLSVDRVVLAGHSLGGAIALEYALAHESETDPSLAGLVLICTGARLRVKPEVLAAIEEAANAGQSAGFGALAYAPGTDPAIIAREEAAAARTPPSSAIIDWRASDAFDRLADLARVKTKTLVIGGTEDLLTPPKYARYLAEQIDGAELSLLEGAGHTLPFERHDTLARKLHDFTVARRER
jgi:pimeloyl-ACP methyl ester carboxylesterase